jgi:RNA-splicing ligase RtcB
MEWWRYHSTRGIDCGMMVESSAIKGRGRLSTKRQIAYKSIDAVMEAQRDLVDVVHTLRQVVCVKG